jgi:hypothetical protein
MDELTNQANIQDENREPQQEDDQQNSIRRRADRDVDDENENRRMRHVLSPLDLSLLNERFMRRMKEVKVDLLQGESVLEINLNRIYIDVQIIRVITPSPAQKANIYGVRRKNSNNQEVHFSRLFLCRIHSELDLNEHSRLIYLMEAKNSNNMLFDRNLELRDDGTISIGTFLRILAPLPIENNMKGDIALVKTQMPAVVMKRPFKIPSVPVNTQIQENNSMAFVLNGVPLNLNRTVAVQTTCSGFLCDKQRACDWNGQRGCGCYHMTQYRTNIVLEHTIFMDTSQGRIVHSNFSSNKFSLMYLTDNIPGGVRVSALRTTDAYCDIEDAIEDVVDHVNGNGGWTVVGWYKRGVINDRSLLEMKSNATNANVSNNSNVHMEVGAGQVSYHVV